jgi:hypothetical protein
MSQLILELTRRHSSQTWITEILESVKGCSDGVIEHKLLEATLQRRFTRDSVAAHEVLTVFEPDSRIYTTILADLAYCLTVDLSRDNVQRCSQYSQSGYHSVLLVPREQFEEAMVLAREEGIEKCLIIVSIENFVATIIIGLAMDENKDLFSILTEIVNIYNERWAEVETDPPLLIEVR